MSAIVRPCPTHVSGCPCINDDPFANLSSEAPDPADVIRMGYKAANPPINAPEDYWDVPFGIGSCSNADAQDAQDCADGQATQEVDANQETFRSAARTCSVPCPDGSSFSYTLKAGAVTSTTQALADYLAASVCLYRADQARQCGPTAVTGVATDIDSDSAKLNGTVNPNGSSTVVFFEWGTSTSYGHITPITNIGAGNSSVPVSATITGLNSGTTYHFRIVAINSKGTSRGTDATFDTEGATIEVVDLNFFFDLAEDGTVAGNENGGLFDAAFWRSGTGVKPINLGGFNGGNCLCANANNGFGGFGDDNISANEAFRSTGLVATTLGFDGAMRSIAEDGFGAADRVDTTVAYLVDTVGGLTVLGDFGGGYATVGNFAGAFGFDTFRQNRCINDSHVIAVTSKNGANRVKPGRWTAGILTNIQPALGIANNPSASIAIDDNGAILGGYTTAAGTRGFINESGGAVNSMDIGGIGINYVRPQCLSKTGLVACGYCFDGATDVAFKWTKTGGFEVIPLLPGQTFAYGTECNSNGVVVGWSDNKCFIYRNGAVGDLMTLLPPGSGWTALNTADFINDEGQILGTGIHLGVFKNFLLSI